MATALLAVCYELQKQERGEAADSGDGHGETGQPGLRVSRGDLGLCDRSPCEMRKRERRGQTRPSWPGEKNKTGSSQE